MIGQKHYIIVRLEGERQKYWRSRGNQSQRPEWTWNLARATKYRSAGIARSAAMRIDPAPPSFQVRELIMGVGEVVFSVSSMCKPE